MRYVMALIAALFWAGAAHAQTLVMIANTSAGRELLVEQNSLRALPPLAGYRSFPVVQVRVEIRSPGGRRTGPMVERALYNFDCRSGKVATLSYYRGWTNGKRSHDWRGADWVDAYDLVKPGTMTEIAMTYACSGGKLPIFPPPPAAETIPPPETDEEDGPR